MQELLRAQSQQLLQPCLNSRQGLLLTLLVVGLRPFGFVGGLGQHPSRFGPFGLASRTPLAGLWLCGDAIYPGEGTAGVSLSAFTACRQLLAASGRELQLAA